MSGKKRGAEQERDYEILTAEISKTTFGITPSEYKKLKGLKRQNLRDHMDDFELIFTMLGERSIIELHATKDSKGLPALKDDAKTGGNVVAVARKELKKQLGRSVVSKKNYLKKNHKTRNCWINKPLWKHLIVNKSLNDARRLNRSF